MWMNTVSYTHLDVYKRQPSKLYLVDDLGNVYEMDKESQNETDYSFRTSAADLAGIGDHFKVMIVSQCTKSFERITGQPGIRCMVVLTR